jgi:hypothetical protein
VVGVGSLHASGALYEVIRNGGVLPPPRWLVDAFAEMGLGALRDVIRGARGTEAGAQHQTLVNYSCSGRARNTPQTEAAVLFRQAWERREQPPGDLLDCAKAEGILRDVYQTKPVHAAYADQSDEEAALDAAGFAREVELQAYRRRVVEAARRKIAHELGASSGPRWSRCVSRRAVVADRWPGCCCRPRTRSASRR